MRKVKLGRTGADVAALCLGTMYFGTRQDEETSRDLLDAYVDAGGDFLDTANPYAHWVEGGHGGESELLLGRWLKDRGNREDLFIATKVGFGYEGTNEFPGAEEGLRAEQIEAECDKSLKRMGIDTIDLYYAHRDDRTTPLEETLEAFDRLVKAGKVRFLGASNYKAWRLVEAIRTSRENGGAEYLVTQQRHTYLRYGPNVDWKLWPQANEEFFEVCRTYELPTCAYSPLLRGAYDRADRGFGAQYDHPDAEAQYAALQALAEAKGVTCGQLVLAWMMHQSPRVIPLFSCSGMEQLSEDLGALEIELSADEMQTLDEAGA